MTPEEFRAQIQQNIATQSFHVTAVRASDIPKYCYTIGLSPKLGFEIVLAGRYDMTVAETTTLLRRVGDSLLRDSDLPAGVVLQDADASWSEKLLLGVFDYFGSQAIRCVQLRPARVSVSDEPDMASAFVPSNQSPWRWLSAAWTYPVPADEWVTANQAALERQTLSRVCRWDDGFEMMSYLEDGSTGPIYVVPMSTAIAVQPRIAEVSDLSIDECAMPLTGSTWDRW